MRRNVIGILTIGASILALILIWFVLSSIKNPPPDSAAIQKIFFVPVQDFHPEPRERWQYLVSVLSLPVICSLFFLVFDRFMPGSGSRTKRLHLILSVSSVVLALLLAVAGLRNVNNNFLAPNILFRSPVLAIAFCMTALLILVDFQRLRKLNGNRFLGLLYFLLGGCLLVLVGIETLFNESGDWVPIVHFVAVFDAVVQTYLGKTLLVDINTQYGLYPLLLDPVFQLIGLDVLKFTIVMGLLKVMAFGSLLLLLWGAVENKVIAFFGFGSLVFYFRLRMPIDISTDPYFQYVPIRFLFPTVFVFLLWKYLTEKSDSRKKVLYYLVSLFCAVAVLWNSDTGLVVFLTWIASLLFLQIVGLRVDGPVLTIRRSAEHILVAAGSLAFVWAGFYLYTYLKSGQLPDVQSMFFATGLFYFYGFFMKLIDPVIHPWNMVVLAYIVGLFVSIRYLFESNGIADRASVPKESEKAINALVFSLSILGIGLFNYFVGRSFDIYLVWPSWPVVILLTLFTDTLFSSFSALVRRTTLRIAAKTLFSSRWIYRHLLLLIMFTFLSSSTLSIVIYLSNLDQLISSRFAGIRDGIPERLRDSEQLIERNASAEDTVLVLSDYAPELYLFMNKPRPLNVPSFGEMALVSDLDKITNFLANPPDNALVFWDTAFGLINPSRFDDLIPVAYSKDRDLILYAKKTK